MRGADPDEKDLCGQTPLMNAVMLGKLDLTLVKKLQEMRAKPDVKDTEGKTPLIRAVEAQYLDDKMVAILLRHNADPSLKDCRGRGPLYWACLKGRRRLAMDTIVPALQAKGNPSFQG